ncbi:MAG: helix-turn-helix domain-containing protein [Candidatus Limnocylindria bacterium]
MATRTRPQYEASRLETWIRNDVGRELRLARTASGMRQTDVARLLGTSGSRISRVEHGLVRTLNLHDLAHHAAAVGLKPYLKLFPLGRRLLDRPQLELLGRFRARLHPSWSWETEVPVPIPGDLRAGDCRITIPGCAVLVEAFTRLSDYQAQVRNARRKQADLGADRLILLLAATHANRRAIAEAGAVARASFPCPTKETLRSLAIGADPGRDAIVFL